MSHAPHRPLAALLLGLAPWLAAGCGAEAPGSDDVPEPVVAASPLSVELSPALRARLASMSPLPRPPADPTNRVADDPAAARLGQALFFDARLSGNGAVSCATCHVPERQFTDGLSLAQGLSTGTRHTPTLWNVAYHRWLTWDGRADSLWMQALDPIEDPREMGGSRAEVAQVIASDGELAAAYRDVFGPLPEGLAAAAATAARPARRGEAPGVATVRRWEELADTDRAALSEVFVNAGKAIAAYQRLLVRGEAPFDRFVRGLASGDPGELGALSAEAQRGLLLFFGKGNCVLCHSGPVFSDGEFHNNALPTLHGGEARDAGRYDGAAVVQGSPFNAAGAHSDAPQGEAAEAVRSLRRSSETWGEFRTPSLRNLVGRGPYMHQGQFRDLAEVIRFYSDMVGTSVRAHHQEQFLQPLRLTHEESSDLEAFLRSLDGAPPDPALLAPPGSPRIASDTGVRFDR